MHILLQFETFIQTLLAIKSCLYKIVTLNTAGYVNAYVVY
jgi:hypothetical protein